MQHLVQGTSVSPVKWSRGGAPAGAACCSTLSRLGLASTALDVCISISMVRQGATRIDPITDYLPSLDGCAADLPVLGNQRSVSRICSSFQGIKGQPSFHVHPSSAQASPSTPIRLVGHVGRMFPRARGPWPSCPYIHRVRAKSHAAASAPAPAPAKGPVWNPVCPRGRASTSVAAAG